MNPLLHSDTYNAFHEVWDGSNTRGGDLQEFRLFELESGAKFLGAKQNPPDKGQVVCSIRTHGIDADLELGLTFGL